MTRSAIARRFGRVDRFRLLGATGYVSDDTEQAALIAQALIESPDDLDRAVRLFRRGLLGWACRLPWGVGRATVRACGRIALGRRRSGVPSAGNGAAMRSAIVGVFFRDRPAERRDWARRFAEVTHVDPRAVDGAIYVAEVAAAAAGLDPGRSRADAVAFAISILPDGELAGTLARAAALARAEAETEAAATVTGRSGYVVATVAFATFLYLRHGDDPMHAWVEGIAAGGDADTIAAILGGWMGAERGEAGLPGRLIARLQDGPFGPTHLRALAEALAAADDGVGRRPPRYSRLGALVRNLALWPVILAHGFRRLIPTGLAGRLESGGGPGRS